MKKVEIPLLTERDIDCRVQSVAKNKNGKVGATVLLYKDARVDMRILDELFGTFGWQRTHEVINDNLFCSIDIWDEDEHKWVRKQDVGVESYTEKEKGEASDSFKRAGFNVGIGRELYTAPFIYIELDENEWYNDKDGKVKCSASTKFDVSHIGYNDSREISELTVIDKKGNERFTFGAKKPKSSYNAKSAPVSADEGKTELTYEQALEVMFQGRKLRDIYKTDRAFITEIYKSCPNNVKKAIEVINKKIKEANG